MKYITIDGDDIGQKITASYLKNDVPSLLKINDLVHEKTKEIAHFLTLQGFVIIFCAADGVAGYSHEDHVDDELIFKTISNMTEGEITFSMGIGTTLRESYIALLSAKSNGKACLHNFEKIK